MVSKKSRVFLLAALVAGLSLTAFSACSLVSRDLLPQNTSMTIGISPQASSQGVSSVSYTVTGVAIDVTRVSDGSTTASISWVPSDGSTSYDLPVPGAGDYDVTIVHTGINGSSTVSAVESTRISIQPMIIAVVTVVPGQIGVITVDATVTQTIGGPTLDTGIVGWTAPGLQFEALQDVTLTSFTFNNQGAADTVELLDGSGTVLHSYSTPAGDNAHVANVNWTLTAGTTYRLVGTLDSNGMWTSYSSFPTANTHLSVDGSWGGSALYTGFWFSFTNLVTVQ